jgi:multiple sugar transport system substrate-binding protein
MSEGDTHPTRRKTLKFAGTIGAGALMAGCAGGERGSGSGSGGGTSGEDEPLVTHERVGTGGTAIDYWTSSFYSPSEEQSGQPAAAPALREQYTNWAENHPDYRLELQYQSNLDQWQNNLLQRAARDEAPPGSTLDSFWVPNLYEYLQPLNDAVEDVDDFFPFVRETAMRDGDLLAAWKYTDCRCLYYRQDLIDRYAGGDPPATWEEVIDVGTEIANQEDMNGYLYLNSSFNNLSYFWGQGGTLVDDQGAPVLDRDENRRAMVETLSFLRRTVEEGITPRRVANLSDHESMASEARNGQAAMFVGGNWQIFNDFRDKMDGDSWRNWQVAQIPMKEADQAATGTGGWTEGYFASEGEMVEPVRDFAARSVAPEAMGRYCEAAGLLPTRASVYDDREYFSENEYQQQFREFLQDGVARPAFPIFLTIDSEFETAIGKVLTEQASPEAATDTMIQNVNEEYDSGY